VLVSESTELDVVVMVMVVIDYENMSVRRGVSWKEYFFVDPSHTVERYGISEL
jgi:hypothetical protein